MTLNSSRSNAWYRVKMNSKERQKVQIHEYEPFLMNTINPPSNAVAIHGYQAFSPSKRKKSSVVTVSEGR